MATIRLKYVNAFNNKHRKSILPRYYFRRPGCKAIPLPGWPGSDEFMAAYAAALAMLPSNNKSEIGAKRTGVGTIDALVATTFYKSTHWTNLSPQSQQTYAPVIDKFRARHGRLHVATLQAKHVGLALDEVAKPSAKRKLLKALRLLMRAAIPSMRADDPTAGIKVTMPKSKGWHPWSDEEIELYRARWPLGTEARLVFEFALETASRRSEVVRLGPQHVRNGRIRIERTHGSSNVDIQLTAELTAAVMAMPKAKHLTFIVGRGGKPLTGGGLAKRFAEWATAAGLPSCCRLHGLKKGGMRRIAEMGASAHQLMSWSGHKTLAMIAHYTDSVDRAKLADDTAQLIERSRSVPGKLTNTRTPDLQTSKKSRA
jgi:integrase